MNRQRPGKRESEEAQPPAFCPMPHCLERTGGTLCPKHCEDLIDAIGRDALAEELAHG